MRAIGGLVWTLLLGHREESNKKTSKRQSENVRWKINKNERSFPGEEPEQEGTGSPHTGGGLWLNCVSGPVSLGPNSNQ